MKHLSVTKPLLSYMTQVAVPSGKALFRSFSHIREGLPHHSGPDPKTFLPGLVHGVKLQP